MTRAVIWSRHAARDFIELVRFISQDSPEASQRIGAQITETARKLGVHSTGRPGRIVGIYEKSVPKLPYVIAYEVQKYGAGAVVIHRIIHTACDWPHGRWPKAKGVTD